MSKARQLADLGNVYDDGALSNRNRIINGDFSIWQRGTSSTSTGWGYHTADRWNTTLRDGAGTMSQYDMGAELRPFTYALKTAITSAATSSPAIQQRIEDSRKFKNQTVTLSFYAKASKNITVDTYFNLIWANTDNTTTAQSNSITTSWQKFTLTATLPDPTGTYNSTYDNFICRFDLPISDTYDFYLTGVQLEVGDTATPFEHRSYGDELARCQRYYYKVSRIRASARGSTTGSNQSIYSSSFPTTMRVEPTLVWDTSNGQSGTSDHEFYGASAEHVNAYCTINDTSYWYINYGYTADAEL